MNAVAVVKPDHIGDFVLSIPALRAIYRRFGEFDLFAAPENHFLSEYFLPDVAPLPMKLRHLTKGSGGIDLKEFRSDLARYRLVIFLRDDQVIRETAAALPGVAVHPHGSDLLHETLIQKRAVMPMVGGYSRTDLFPCGIRPWPEEIRCVGISLSAGFFSNRLPMIVWLKVARILRDRGVRLKVIGGPAEVDDVRFLARRLALNVEDTVIGGKDVGGFLDAVGACDIVAGADSGTMHLVSVRRPVLGIFTSSPWRRFSPFGAQNRIIYSVVPCSPCAQFSRDTLNGCLSQECAALITPEEICGAMFLRMPAGEVAVGPAARLVAGPSHAHQIAVAGTGEARDL